MAMRTCPAAANETNDARPALAAGVDAAAAPSAASAAAAQSNARPEWGPLRKMTGAWQSNATASLDLVRLVRARQRPDDAQLALGCRSLVAAMLTALMAFLVARHLLARRRAPAERRRRWRDAGEAVDYEADDSESIGARAADDSDSEPLFVAERGPSLGAVLSVAVQVDDSMHEWRDEQSTIDPLIVAPRLPVFVEHSETELFPCARQSMPVCLYVSPPDCNNNESVDESKDADDECDSFESYGESESCSGFASFGSSMNDSFHEPDGTLSDVDDFVSAPSPMLSARSEATSDGESCERRMRG